MKKDYCKYCGKEMKGKKFCHDEDSYISDTQIQSLVIVIVALFLWIICLSQ